MSDFHRFAPLAAIGDNWRVPSMATVSGKQEPPPKSQLPQSQGQS